MFRSWTHRLKLLALASLAALPASALGQVATTPPTEVLVPVPAVANLQVLALEPQGQFELALAAPPHEQGVFAFAPQAQALLPAPGQKFEAGTFLFTQEAAPPTDARVRVKVLAEDTAAAPESPFWIGVQLEPLPEIVVSQLKLERGMVVVQVFDDSPAAKAEVKVHDILLRAADKDIKEPQDLIAAVNDAQDKELTIVALRAGTETTLKVTPAKRQAERVELRVSPETPHAEVVQRLEELYKRNPDGGVRLFAVRPGGVYAYAQTARFPDNLEINIEKRGDKPATIRVKRIQEGEDKSWEVTEDKLDDLPEDIRQHVQQMLSGNDRATPQALSIRLDDGMAQARAQARAQVAKAQDAASQAQAQARRVQERLGEYRVRVREMPVSPPVPVPPIAVRHIPDGGIQEKLDAILKKLDQQQGDSLQRLQAEVEKLRKDLEDLRQEKK